jgi:hypothetical protein
MRRILVLFLPPLPPLHVQRSIGAEIIVSSRFCKFFFTHVIESRWLKWMSKVDLQFDVFIKKNYCL